MSWPLLRRGKRGGYGSGTGCASPPRPPPPAPPLVLRRDRRTERCLPLRRPMAPLRAPRAPYGRQRSPCEAPSPLSSSLPAPPPPWGGQGAHRPPFRSSPPPPTGVPVRSGRRSPTRAEYSVPGRAVPVGWASSTPAGGGGPPPPVPAPCRGAWLGAPVVAAGAPATPAGPVTRALPPPLKLGVPRDPCAAVRHAPPCQPTLLALRLQVDGAKAARCRPDVHRRRRVRPGYPHCP